MAEYCVNYNTDDQNWLIYEADDIDETRVLNAVTVCTYFNYFANETIYYYGVFVESKTIVDAFRQAIDFITDQRKINKGLK